MIAPCARSKASVAHFPSPDQPSFAVVLSASFLDPSAHDVNVRYALFAEAAVESECYAAAASTDSYRHLAAWRIRNRGIRHDSLVVAVWVAADDDGLASFGMDEVRRAMDTPRKDAAWCP